MTTSASSITVLGAILLHFLWQGTAIAVALGFVLLLVPKRWARARYLCACLALAAMTAAPLATAYRLASAGAGAPATASPFAVPRAATVVAVVSGSAGMAPATAFRASEGTAAGPA